MQPESDAYLARIPLALAPRVDGHNSVERQLFPTVPLETDLHKSSTNKHSQISCDVEGKISKIDWQGRQQDVVMHNRIGCCLPCSAVTDGTLSTRGVMSTLNRPMYFLLSIPLII